METLELEPLSAPLEPEKISSPEQFVDMVSLLEPGEVLTYWRGATLLDSSKVCPDWLRTLSWNMSRERTKFTRRGHLIYSEKPKYTLLQKKNGPFDFSYFIQKL